MMILDVISGVFSGIPLGFFLAFAVFGGKRRKRFGALGATRLVPFDVNGPIIGKPTRAQWRLRRRALLEAAEICEFYALGSSDAANCAFRVRLRIQEYDRLSPEFSGVAVASVETETAA